MSDNLFNTTDRIFYELITNTTATDYGLTSTTAATTTAFFDPVDSNATFTSTTTRGGVSLQKKSVATGFLTRDEYLHYTVIFTWIKAIGQPISVFFLILSALVFMRRGMRNSSTGLLVTLNLAEAYNVSLLSVYQICKLTDSCLDVEAYTVFLLYSSTFVGIACRRSVYLFNCLVAVQRFLVVAFPMRSKDWTILHRPKTISVAVILLMLLVHAYIPVKYEVKRFGTEYKPTTTQMARDHNDIFSTITTANICITSYLPLLVGLFANIGMGTSLYLHSKSMKDNMADTSGKQLKRSRKHSQTTILVLTSTLLFFVFALPSTLNYVIMETSADYGPLSKEKYLYLTLSSGFVLCQVVSDLVVFFSYVCVGSAFREHLVAIFLGSYRKKPVLRNMTT